jgi:hypothetical protein
VDGKYPLVTLEIPVGLIVEGDMLRNIVSLKFSNHNITDEHKFPVLAWEKCLCTKGIQRTREILLEP